VSTAHKFINPPLIALAYGTSERERIDTLLQWGLIDVGRRCFQHWKKQIQAGTDAGEILQAIGRIRTLIDRHDIDADKWLETYSDETAWALGVETLGLNPEWRTVRPCLDAHTRLSTFFDQMRKATGGMDKKPCFVHGLKLDWVLATWRTLWQADNGKDDRLEYGHFAVLCAVLSKIGSNKPPAKRCGCYEIQRRALGYSSAGEMEAALPFRPDSAQPMSRDMIDRRTQQLALAHFFVRHTPKTGKRAQTAWYGSGIDRAKLVQIAEAAKMKAKGGWKARWRAQQAVQTALYDNVIAFQPGAEMRAGSGVDSSRFNEQKTG
jgi:hypothetical protein